MSEFPRNFSRSARAKSQPHIRADVEVSIDVSDLAEDCRLADLRAFTAAVAALPCTRRDASPRERRLYSQGDVIAAVRAYRDRTRAPIVEALEAVAVGWHGSRRAPVR